MNIPQATDDTQPVLVKCICPSCGSRSMRLIEYWKSAIDFLVIDGLMSMADGNLFADGTPFKVVATCLKCRHEWRVRKARQIISVICEQ